MLKTILLDIYIFSALLSFFLLVRLSCGINNELCEELKVRGAGWSIVKIAFFTFIDNFFYILIPIINTLLAILLLIIMLLPQYEELLRESVRRGIFKAKDARGLSDEEFEKLIDKVRDKENENEE